jgi:hypothetical protein
MMHVQEEDLEMYILESLPLREQSAITSHLGSCPTCQGKLIESVRFASKIAALKQTPKNSGKEPRRFARIASDMAASIRVLSPASSGKTSARVLDTSKDSLQLRVSEFIHPGATIQVRFTDTVAFGEVRFCRPAGSAFHAGVLIRDSFRAPDADAIQTKRKEPRNEVTAAACLRTVNGEDLHQVTVLDVSRSGLRVRSAIGMATGARVEVTYGDVTIAGEVRYARELAPDEFNMGINADRVTGASDVQENEMDLTLLFNLA